ncbi:T9SS type A sorting domain-containing protein [Flavicella sediminum]|uniref:T9SS type A sorting domain-containing protein n=1 Tax=Flavicella sediminum TaxID=2585141 RepID=UPI0011237707|nr:T9SS type A sorting domain-containing protein [Flavicella sediminum]
MKKNISVFIILFTLNFGIAQEFKIIGNNSAKRRDITHRVRSGDFTIGINKFGGGYITEIDIPGIGNIMGVQAQKYGRGGQSSIRDLGRGGQYNPTQAGFSDNAGTECAITTVSPSKLIIPSRGCALYNGDGHFDFTNWENISADHPNINDAGNTDQDGIDESNLSVTIDGKTYSKQEAEVHSDFDFYGEYEDYSTITGISIPAIRHYFEYRFIRSSTLPNSAMKQFNEVALKGLDKPEWNDAYFLNDISVENPIGVHTGGTDHLNSISLSWSIRNDVALWDPGFRYKQLKNGSWERLDRDKVNRGYEKDYKLRFIISDSDNENEGHALGFYLPSSDINSNNIVGIKESDNSIAYKDNRTSDRFFNDQPRRTPTMGWIGFRSTLNGVIDRSHLTDEYAGIYEMIRAENIMLVGTTAEIKAAFIKLDQYYADLLATDKVNDEEAFIFFPNPTNDKITIALKNSISKLNIYNSLGKEVYSWKGNSKKLTIPVSKIGTKGIYFLKVNNTTKEFVIK